MKTECIDARSGPGTRKSALVLAMLFLVLSVKLLEAAGPKQETLRAWDEYTRIVTLRVAKSSAGDSQFLWIDDSQDRIRRVRQDEVVVIDHDPHNIPQGLIHHWIGAVFVPQVTLDQALSVVESYDRYCEFYKPLLSKSTVLAREGDQATLNIVAVQKALSVTAAVDTEDRVQVVRADPKKAYITNEAVKVDEIVDYGKPSEHTFPESRRIHPLPPGR